MTTSFGPHATWGHALNKAIFNNDGSDLVDALTKIIKDQKIVISLDDWRRLEAAAEKTRGTITN